MRNDLLLTVVFFTTFVFTAARWPAVLADDTTTEKDTNAQGTGRIEGRVLPLARPRLTEEQLRALDAAGDKAVLKKLPAVKVHSVKLYMPGSGVVRGETRVNEDGTFAFDAAPRGTVRLLPTFRVRESPGVFSLNCLDVTTTVEERQTTRVTFFGKGRPVRGKLELPRGIESRDVRVRLVLVAPPFRVVFGRDGKPNTGPGWDVYGLLVKERQAEVDDEGEFCIHGVREGEYRIVVDPAGGKKPTRLRFDSITAAGHLHVKHGKFTVPLMSDGESESPASLGTLRFGITAE